MEIGEMREKWFLIRSPGKLWIFTQKMLAEFFLLCCKYFNGQYKTE